MKILEINVYNYRCGGSETVYLNTSQLMRDHGHEVVSFTLKWDKNLDSPYQEFFPESKETRKGILRPVKNITTYFYNSEAARKLDKLIQQENPDIAQIHLIWGQLTPSILKVLKKHNIPAVLTIHDYRIVCPAYVFRNGKGEVCEKCQGKHFYKCVTNTCCKNSKFLSIMMTAEQYFRNAFYNPAKLATGLIYVSEFAKAIHEKYMPALKNLPSVTLYNMSTEIDKASGKKASGYFLYFGRLSSEKGVRTLIEAFSQLPDINLKIVGTGPEEDAMKSMASNIGANNIEFLGYKSGNDLETLLRGAYFVIVPSEWYENNPMTIIEAYSCATPVIGSSIGGIPEILPDKETGFQFETGNAEDLKKAILKAKVLSESEYKHMCSNALEFAKTNFDKDVYYTTLIEFFSRLTAK